MNFFDLTMNFDPLGDIAKIRTILVSVRLQVESTTSEDVVTALNMATEYLDNLQRWVVRDVFVKKE